MVRKLRCGRLGVRVWCILPDDRLLDVLRLPALQRVDILVEMSQLPVQDGVCEALGEGVGARAEHRRLHPDRQLGYLSSRESLGALGHHVPVLVVQRRIDNDLPASLSGSVDVLVDKHLDHLTPTLQIGQGELELFVDTVEHGSVHDLTHVGRQHHTEVGRLSASVMQKGREAVSEFLRHGALAHSAAPQEGVSLVDEQDQPFSGAVGPSEELVDLVDRVLAERPDVSARHDGIVETRIARDSPCEKGFAGPRGAVEEKVSERRAVPLGVDQRVRRPLQPL
mmetsp:Transcript_1978/g.4346  ORF Transcript_1978/g.4346 Transcript_1978/m.4346 type:complete len:281 (-) Transcript_1978:894-1736(-)